MRRLLIAYFVLAAIVALQVLYVTWPYRTLAHRVEPPQFPWYVDGLHHNSILRYYDNEAIDFFTFQSTIPDEWRGKR